MKFKGTIKDLRDLYLNSSLANVNKVSIPVLYGIRNEFKILILWGKFALCYTKELIKSL